MNGSTGSERPHCSSIYIYERVERDARAGRTTLTLTTVYCTEGGRGVIEKTTVERKVKVHLHVSNVAFKYIKEHTGHRKAKPFKRESI